MPIRSKKNHGQEHTKSVNGLKRAGLNGLVITGNPENGNIIVSWLGNFEKAMLTAHKAIQGTPILLQIAKAVAFGPQTELEVTDSEGVNKGVNEGVIAEETRPENEMPYNPTVSMAPQQAEMFHEAVKKEFENTTVEEE